MRIMHLIPSLARKHGGPTKACLEMSHAIAERGHDVVIHTTDAGLDDGERTTLLEDHGGRVYVHPCQIRVAGHYSWPLARAIEAEMATTDVVHMHSLYMFHNLVGWRACRRHNVPYLLRPHGSLDPYLWRHHRLRKMVAETAFMNRVLEDAAAIHYTSEEEKLLAAPYARNPRAVIIANGIWPTDYEDLPDRHWIESLFEDEGGETDLRIVLFFGRLHFKKGLDLLASGFAEAAARDPKLRLVVAGPDGGMEARLRSWLDEYGVADRTRFTGFLDGRDKLAALTGADLFVLPSYSENFGISVIEAMVCGTPVVVSDKVNIWREIEADGAGKVIPCDKSALAEAISSMLADPNALAAAGSRARQSAQARYAWPLIAPRLEAVYSALAAGQTVDTALDAAASAEASMLGG